jgi:outer membrane protein TolC
MSTPSDAKTAPLTCETAGVSTGYQHGRRTARVATLCVVALIASSHANAQSVSASQASLRLIDAVQSALSHPAVEIQRQQVEIEQALAQEASAAFNEVVKAGLDGARSYTPRATESSVDVTPTSTSQATASFSRLLRNGVSVTGALDVQSTLDERFRSSGLTTSRTSLELLFPLMRGRGRQATTAEETSARLSVNASELVLRHAQAAQVASVVSSYWQLVAAARTLAVQQASTARGELLVENTRALIAADQSPRADLALALANLADREAAQVAAEQARIAARRQLILDLGVRPEEFPEQPVLDDFPPLAPVPPIGDDPALLRRLVDAALDRRADYAAAKARLGASRVSADAAKNGLRPRVDLSVNFGYTGVVRETPVNRGFAGLFSGVEGADVVGRVAYEFPVRNSRALGRLLEASAEQRQADLRVAELARDITASVAATYSTLEHAVRRLEKARESVEAFKSALQGERDKLALGIGSIVNLLTIEDRLTTAAEREVAAWNAYGQVLIEFRLATGSLVPRRGPLPALDETTFTTFPSELLASERSSGR